MRALLGVADRTGVVEFARGLRENGVDLVATDGTRRALADAGIEATAVGDLTGFPPLLDGRVKTLHPAVHAGILARRDVPEHMAELADHGFSEFDIVAVSLYPFAQTVAGGADHAAAIEKIDIGGPTMIRAAAKNSVSVAVLVEPAQYGEVLDELRELGGISQPTRERLAARAFAHTAAYDTAVADYLASLLDGEQATPAEYTTGGTLIAPLRYGENPHQRGALYALPGPAGGLAHARQVQGPALSFTNWLDCDAARRLVCDFEEPAAAVIKHTNPCGFAVGTDIADAYRRAYECDPQSAYGGIVALNRPLDEATAEQLAATFLEAVVVPAISDDAANRLAAKQRLRVLVVERPSCASEVDVRSVDGGLLVQTTDRVGTDRSAMTVVSGELDEARWRDLLVAWRVCARVKSNAIVIVRDGMAVGVGAGQMSRVEAAELAVHRAGDRAAGAVAASDAFFPFPDGVETLGKAGITAVIQPGGSRKDDEVTAAAERLGVAMVHTGERHFRH
ncbi:MAG TPA: bifunctional phosphoribosylaminoimidazolecarboxamide formyltransferase/IMP cyclohydrolase [Candidatus Dormibacteraeota bacterium]|nr:bifunctional phosphoribosylaminoimidazolecarboxamide formyltransferase/IMP cyclohydrolase [Candidatus Dormibacteraeota bacterium]